MIRFGTNPIAWSNDDDPDLGGDISLSRCLEEAAEIGFDGIERGNKMPDDATQLTALLAPHGLAYVSAWYSLNLLIHDADTEIAAIGPRLELLKAMGCSVCIACETSNTVHGNDQIPLSARPILKDNEWPAYGAKLEQVAAHCRSHGITLAYHHHMGTITQSMQDIDNLMRHTGPALHLLIDTGHAWLAGGDPAVLAEKHMDRVAHIHIKNVRPAIREQLNAENLSFLDAVRRGIFTVPGDPEGAVDIAPVLKIAARHGYQGWLVVEAEQDPHVRNPFEYQSLGLKTLKKMAQEAGLGTQTQ